MRHQLADTFRSLRVRNFRLFLIGQLIALIGTWMRFIALDWLALDLSGNSGAALGLVTAFQLAPTLVFALYAGKLADRFDKRRILQICNAIWFVLTATLAVLIMSGNIQLWQIYAFSLVLGVVSAQEIPTRQAFASELVGPELLPNALALNGATFNSARIVGPAVAGVLIALIDVGPIFAINAVTLAVTVITMAMMNPAELHRPPKAKTNATVREGLAYVRRRPDLLLPLGLILIIGGFGFNFQVTLALLAKSEFGVGPAAFGLLTTALAVGALAGALGGTKRRKRPGVYLLLGAAMGFGALEMIAGFSPNFVTAVILLVPTGFLMVFFAQAANQRVQMGVSPSMRGRVMALYVMVFIGSAPIIAPLVGWLAEVLGPRSGLWAGGALSLAAGLIALIYRSRRRNVVVSLERRPRPHLVFAEPGRTAISFPNGSKWVKAA
ncbi:hypothetical protein Afil01_56750 [Actinorhabdospora filicis]|uniref:Major facilitator superfamily (MFS) profile domain-containing protein n=1 Tax=Actinorhabdospora filicis TaxID=1785913 RepID=A0A9W6SR77_9ACTN|nr:MFS transporter [Actinorhabdospora filicis]GLZ80868.1 hypothetical protein Afil01_56750 [Actinorhabdospora filicis]